MNLQFKQQIQPSSTIQNAVIQLKYSPNDEKIAAIRYDRQIQFFNSAFQQTEILQTRGADHTKITDTYIPTCIAWSNDSQHIVLGQSDNSVYVYAIGQNFEKKSIIGKAIVQSPVTAITWMNNSASSLQSDIIIGCANGDVWSYNLQQKRSELLFNQLTINKLVTTKQIQIQGGCQSVEGTNTPIIDLHPISQTEVVIVSATGVSGIYELNQRILSCCQRSQTNNLYSTILTIKHSQIKYLVTVNSANTLTFTNIQTALATQQLKIQSPEAICSITSVSTGNTILVSTATTINIVQPVQQQPLVTKLIETFRFKQNQFKNQVSVNSNGSAVIISYSNGRVDLLNPTLNTSSYCNVQINQQAQNTYILNLKTPLKFEVKNSSEIQRIHAYPESEFKQCLSTNTEEQFNGYIVAFGDKSIMVYSNKKQKFYEIIVTVNLSDKIYFDVGETGIIIIARAELQQFQPFLLTEGTAIQFPVCECCFPGRNLISCHYDMSSQQMTVVHLGNDRNTISVDSLEKMSQDAMFDDFGNTNSLINNYKLQVQPDWIDLSPSGDYFIVRGVNGSIQVLNTKQNVAVQISTTMGNGVCFWAVPYDVLVGQELSENQIQVFYSISNEVKPTLITLQNEQQLQGCKITKEQQGVLPAEVSLILSNNQLIPLKTETLIFTSLLQSKNVAAATLLLSKNASMATQIQWQQLLQLSFETKNFPSIYRCFIALKQYQKAQYAKKVNNDLANLQNLTPQQLSYYKQAQISLLCDDLNEYEKQLNLAGMLNLAIETYKSLGLWERCITLATPQQKVNLQQEKLNYYRSTNQTMLQAKTLCEMNQFNEAVSLMIQDGAILSAGTLVLRLYKQAGQQINQLINQQLILQLTNQLETNKLNDLAAQIQLNVLNQPLQALNNYKISHNYQQALIIAQSTSPADQQFIEADFANFLQQKQQYKQAALHCKNANLISEAIKCYLKCSDTDNAAQLLNQSTIDYNTASLLKLQLGQIMYFKGKPLEAAKYFTEADQPLLAVQSLISVGEFAQAVQLIKSKFQGDVQSQVVRSECNRLLGKQNMQMPSMNLGGGMQFGGMSQPTQYGGYGSQQTPSQVATGILNKIQQSTTVTGPNAATALFTACEMYDDAIEVFKQFNMLIELINYVDKNEIKNYSEIYQYVAQRQQNEPKAAATTLYRLCIKLQNDKQPFEPFIAQAVDLLNKMQLFDTSISYCIQLGSQQLLINTWLAQLGAQPSMKQKIIQEAKNNKLVDQLSLKAAQAGQQEFAVALSDYSENPDNVKLEIYENFAHYLQSQNQYTEAHRYYTLANKPLAALEMYLQLNDFIKAENVVNNQLIGNEKVTGSKLLKQARAAQLLSQNNLAEAEKLYCELGMFKLMVSEYQNRNLWKEALNVAKMSGDAELKQMVIGGFQVVASEETVQQKQEFDDVKVVIGAKTYKQQLEEVMKNGDKTQISNLVLTHMEQLSVKLLANNISQQDIAEDELILVNLLAKGETNPYLRAHQIFICYITKGVPRSLIDQQAPAKSTVQLIIGPQTNVESLVKISKAVLHYSCSINEWKALMNNTSTDSGIYSVIRQLLVTYKLRIKDTQNYKNFEVKNPLIFIANSQELSRCFNCLQLIYNYARLSTQNISFTSLKDLANISASLLKFLDLVPTDRHLYLAGQWSQQLSLKLANETSAQIVQFRTNYQNQAIIFFNSFLDVVELSPGSDLTQVDWSMYRDTSISDCLQKQPKMSSTLFLNPTEQQIEDTRQYIMQQSLSQQTDPELPREKCPFSANCQAKLWICETGCKTCQKNSAMCVMTGMHTCRKAGMQMEPVCKNCSCHSRPAQWNAFVEKSGSCIVCGELGVKI